MTIIDPHVHLFSLSRGEYGWLKPENPPCWREKAAICRDVSEFELGAMNLGGYVHIEAGFDNARPWREVNWLQSHCRLPVRIVGGIALTSADFHTQLDALSAKPQVAGVRDILDARAAELLGLPLVRHRLSVIADRGLVFEAQLSLTDLHAVSQLEKVLDSNPQLSLVINHGGFPPLSDEQRAYQMLRWEQSLRRLAAYPHVSIKLSGWEMMTNTVNWEWISRIIDTTLSVFGSKRVMMASNFPLVTFRMGYAAYWDCIRKRVPAKHGEALLHSNASRIYGFQSVE